MDLMDYTELKDGHRAQILRERIRTLEEHHYKLMLDLRDAEDLKDGATLEQAEARREVLEKQLQNAKDDLAEIGPKRRKK